MSKDPISWFLLRPKTARPKRIEKLNRERQQARMPLWRPLEEEVAAMVAAGAAATARDVDGWINHPDERVLTELMVRLPEKLDAYWVRLMGWAVARQRKRKWVWTWMLDRVWDAVTRHAPEALSHGGASGQALDLHLKSVDERTCAVLLGAYISTPVWAGVALHARDAEFLRACGAMRRYDCWAPLMANPHVGKTLRAEVLRTTWNVVVGVEGEAVNGPTPSDVQPHEAIRGAALDILEQAPEFLSTRAPEELHGALDRHDHVVQLRVAALSAMVGTAN